LELGKEKVHNAKRNQSENSPFKMQKPNDKLVQSVQRSKCMKVGMHEGHKSQMLKTLD
jgi:hypothetical protein